MAIAIGEARIVPWPIMSAAFSVSDSGGTTLPKYAGKPRSWSTPMPSEAAASTSASSPSRSACEMMAVLQEFATAVRNGIRPSPPDG